MEIETITVITGQGVKSYCIGDMVNGRIISTISINQIRVNGDPYQHYCGLDSKENTLFSVNCLVPCDITYSLELPTNTKDTE